MWVSCWKGEADPNRGAEQRPPGSIQGHAHPEQREAQGPTRWCPALAESRLPVPNVCGLAAPTLVPEALGSRFAQSRIMKRTERPTVRGPLCKHFDLERKNAKQAEARLRQRLQRLEDIRLYRVKLLSREQRQLQKDLQRLQQADVMKKKFSSYFGNGSQKRAEDVRVFSPQGRQKHRVPQADQTRASGTSVTPKTYKPKSPMPPAHHSGLRDPTRRKEPPSSLNDRAAFFTGEKPQAQEKDSVKAPKSRDSKKGLSVLRQDQDVSTNTVKQGPGSSPAGESRRPQADGTRSQDANLKPGGNAEGQTPPSPVECAGSFEGEATKPTFLELFAKARNAHYVRHRVPPESERLLSVGEIFGHGRSSPPREGAGVNTAQGRSGCEHSPGQERGVNTAQGRSGV
ncbi:coiled-coil domain-containing protein 190 [Eulemur rufifrons]|uniref:coiled-coil domain-containing protein 190 n=1 Tax=Eulemur rufifrons TaxID=859984 RepID=UPI003744AA00